MHVKKVTKLTITLDATEQFVVPHNYADKQLHVTEVAATFREGELRLIEASGFGILSTTGKPGKRPANTRWIAGLRDSYVNAPAKILAVVSNAKQGRSL